MKGIFQMISLKVMAFMYFFEPNIQKWDDGREYSGDWHLGLMHGNGILKWPDGIY